MGKYLDFQYMQNGFFRVAAVTVPVALANPAENIRNIAGAASGLSSRGVRLALFPELSVTGYTCGDLFHNSTLLDETESALHALADMSASFPSTAIVVGAPLRHGCKLLNCAVTIAGGSILAVVPKTYIPNYNEFYEKRWFDSGIGENGTLLGAPMSAGMLLDFGMGIKAGIEICEDLWTPIPPSTRHALAGAQILLNLSASDDLIGKYDYLRNLISQQSARCIAAYIYASAGFGESSTDLVFDGKAIIAENGTILSSSPRWKEGTQSVVCDIDVENLNRDRMHMGSFHDCAQAELAEPAPTVKVDLAPAPAGIPEQLVRTVDPHPFVPASDKEIDIRATEIINIQASGLARRLAATGCRKLVVGISGGLDSTLALLVATRAFDRLKLPRTGIIGITMPGFGTTGRTHSNALTLMEGLGVTSREIGIGNAVMQHFADIGHNPEVHDVTYENSQARERTQILMDVANRENGMVLGTGDLSELALGWATYNGDHMSMYGVNASVPKTLVKYLVRWFADRSDNPAVANALHDIIDTPISPELIPADAEGNIAQKTEDLVGPYELHDFFLYHMLRFGSSPRRIYFLATQAFKDSYPPETIRHWLRIFFRRFFNQQFKRSCLPDGPKVGSVCLSPRGDWRMPSDATSTLWLREVDSL